VGRMQVRGPGVFSLSDYAVLEGVRYRRKERRKDKGAWGTMAAQMATQRR
jgi:hypothetical protein